MGHEIKLNTEQDYILSCWREAKSALDEYKKLEMKYRQQLVDSLLEADIQEGSKTFDIGWGYKLTAKRSLNYSIDKDADIKYLEAWSLSDGKKLLTYVPKLSESVYKKITELGGSIDYITTKPGAPTLELIEPKEK